MKGEETENLMQKYEEKKKSLTCMPCVNYLFLFQYHLCFVAQKLSLPPPKNQVGVFVFNLIMHKEKQRG